MSPHPNMSEAGLASVGLPAVIFMFTIDQLASMLAVQEVSIKNKYLYFVGRTPGRKQRHHMEAVNIAPESDEKAEWRVSYVEFVSWCRRMGFKTREMQVLR